MQIKLKELNKIKGSLSKLLLSEKIPARVAYRATKFSKKVIAEIETLEETRIALVKKFGVNTGTQLQVPPENEGQFQSAFAVVLAEEVELPDIVLALGDLEHAGLSMQDFANLDFMIVERDPTEKP